MDRPALSDVRWQMDGGLPVLLGLQLSGPALNCFKPLVKWCDSDTNGVHIALGLSANLLFLHYDVELVSGKCSLAFIQFRISILV